MIIPGTCPDPPNPALSMPTAPPTFVLLLLVLSVASPTPQQPTIPRPGCSRSLMWWFWWQHMFLWWWKRSCGRRGGGYGPATFCGVRHPRIQLKTNFANEAPPGKKKQIQRLTINEEQSCVVGLFMRGGSWGLVTPPSTTIWFIFIPTRTRRWFLSQKNL